LSKDASQSDQETKQEFTMLLSKYFSKLSVRIYGKEFLGFFGGKNLIVFDYVLI
jgi:hypothetical protein